MPNLLQSIDLPKPWKEHPLTVCVPHLDTPDLLEVNVRLWRLQRVRPFILVIDTGSSSPRSEEMLDSLADQPGIEVARLGILSAVEHLSDRVSIAMDYAFSRCPTPLLLATHVDVFPKHRDLVAKFTNLCNESSPVVGWEMSPRGEGTIGLTCGTLSNGIPGHALAVFHIPTMDRIGAGWSIRRAHHLYGLPRGRTEICGWPDTEVCLGRILADHGIKPVFLGRETNCENQETEDWIHARSSTVQLLVHKQLLERHLRGYREALDRAQQWEQQDAAMPAPTHPIGNNLLFVPRADVGTTAPQAPMPTCHSLRELFPGSEVALCAHPNVRTNDSMVSARVCRACTLRTQAAPRKFRPLPDVSLPVLQAADPQTIAAVIFADDQTKHLQETIDTVRSQTRPADEIVVVDFTAAGNRRPLNEGPADPPSYFLRTSGNPEEGRWAQALKETMSDVICLLDGNDLLAPDYFETGLAAFEQSVGFVYSDAEILGKFDKSKVPEILDRGLLSQRDLVHRSALVRRQALEFAVSQQLSSPHTSTWKMWRTILATGWTARKQASFYRVRPKPAGRRFARIGNRPEPPVTYFDRAELERETVTLCISVPTQIDAWNSLANYLESQEWPHSQTNLVLLESTDNGVLRAAREWVRDSDYRDIRTVSYGQRSSTSVADAFADVSLFASILNQTSTDYVWAVDRGIVPPLDACEQCLRGFDEEIASVSGGFRPKNQFFRAWRDGADILGGPGFGCSIFRTHLVRGLTFVPAANPQADQEAPYFRFFADGMKARVDWSMRCGSLTD